MQADEKHAIKLVKVTTGIWEVFTWQVDNLKPLVHSYRGNLDSCLNHMGWYTRQIELRRVGAEVQVLIPLQERVEILVHCLRAMWGKVRQRLGGK